MEHFSRTAVSPGLCRVCGTWSELNANNMCLICLIPGTSTTKATHKQGVLHFCNSCNRYLQAPSKWTTYQPDSGEFLLFCLQHLELLNKLQLVVAEFIWTEPHSKRIMLKVTAQDTMFDCSHTQKTFIEELIVKNQICQDCKQIYAVVQIRQKVDGKQSVFYLEQLGLKHNLYGQILSVKPVHGGLDLQCASESDAKKILNFITSVLPCRHQRDKKVMFHNAHNNAYGYKHTFSIEIAPITKRSLVCLPKILADQLGGINPLCLVYKITKLIHIIDPYTAQRAEISATTYWKYPFNSVCHPQKLTRFVVMEIEDFDLLRSQDWSSILFTVVDVWLVKETEIGQTECFIHTKSHLGQILDYGDVVLGYAIKEYNINDKHFESIKDDKLPSVVIVEKYCGL